MHVFFLMRTSGVDDLGLDTMSLICGRITLLLRAPRSLGGWGGAVGKSTPLAQAKRLYTATAPAQTLGCSAPGNDRETKSNLWGSMPG